MVLARNSKRRLSTCLFVKLKISAKKHKIYHWKGATERHTKDIYCTVKKTNKKNTKLPVIIATVNSTFT